MKNTPHEMRTRNDLPKLRSEILDFITCNDSEKIYGRRDSLLNELIARVSKLISNKGFKGPGIKDYNFEASKLIGSDSAKRQLFKHNLPLKTAIIDCLIEQITLINNKLKLKETQDDLPEKDKFCFEQLNLAEIQVTLAKGDLFCKNKEYEESTKLFNKAISLSKDNKISICERAINAFGENCEEKHILFAEKRLEITQEAHAEFSEKTQNQTKTPKSLTSPKRNNSENTPSTSPKTLNKKPKRLKRRHETKATYSTTI